MKFVILLALVGFACAGEYTNAPEFHTTVVQGPLAVARVAGEGQRSASSSYAREGSAAGADYARDEAQAAETAAKARGYQYAYRNGYSWYQPKILYAYTFERPIIGTRDQEVALPAINTNIPQANIAVAPVVYPSINVPTPAVPVCSGPGCGRSHGYGGRNLGYRGGYGHGLGYGGYGLGYGGNGLGYGGNGLGYGGYGLGNGGYGLGYGGHGLGGYGRW
ncbi:PREDICTED: postacrosomal sheath WW domain-binding protein-like [Priapulus caudatus]|uniref:Postacrosomal sheath WW domain-binding protein-like n=1 Tax=Priapulus caudatus TaxID=37621 RepID=A0ABM1E3M9_PRICU|nr:PREDICTED: postacrosomal sheath WW domain-binding protein-like [Priapulus caudatus]